MKKQSRFKLLMATLMAIAFNTFVGISFSMALGVPPVYGAAAVNALGIAIGEYRTHFAPDANYASGFLFAGLLKEEYLSLLMKKYRPNSGFLQKCRNLSAYVNNDVINLADAGADPNVIINFDGTYDLPVASDEDSPVALQLKTLSTEQSQIKWNTQRTRAYDIAADRVERHNLTLMQAQGLLGAYGIAPDQDGALKFVQKTTGAADTNGYLIPKLNDFIDLLTRFKSANMNLDNGLVGVINPIHLAYWQKENNVLFKDLLNVKPGDSASVLGVDCFVSNQTPVYDYSTTHRKAYGAAAGAHDSISSFFFLEGEAGYARGTMEAFVLNRTPARQSDFVNFAVAYFAGSIRGKGIGALYSDHA